MINKYIGDCIEFVKSDPQCIGDERVIRACYCFTIAIEDKNLTEGEKAYICAKAFTGYKQQLIDNKVLN